MARDGGVTQGLGELRDALGGNRMWQSRIGGFQEQADKTGGFVLVVGEAWGLAGLMSESTPLLHCSMHADLFVRPRHAAAGGLDV